MYEANADNDILTACPGTHRAIWHLDIVFLPSSKKLRMWIEENIFALIASDDGRLLCPEDVASRVHCSLTRGPKTLRIVRRSSAEEVNGTVLH